MTIVDVFSISKDIILGLAGIIGASAAHRGLNTWKRQTKGLVEYDLAKKLLISTYKYRDAINGVRNPAIWSYEKLAPPTEKAQTMTTEEISYYGTEKCYQYRFSKVTAVCESLYIELLEADAIWGNILKESFNTLKNLQNELEIEIQYYLEILNPNTIDVRKGSLDKILKRNRVVRYDMLGHGEDPYKDEFNAAINQIETILKKFLRS